ncbi:unnamed protein product [Rotaria magnacalcarata]|uniref:Uncharacterized protein n=9 Tax=Rotaria magnacalcarata TaxID=392030 RepID=A0A819DAW3_9BILA|nr:unnamed protein product [Rotaria magnacalcarata]CAF2048793.1 unnamed protein product [Rotaria magnacalcarata]CAF2109167.1 unnamed protein product [Rotaria magnacalcarata]CAF3769738.1 unnamed protein product [Rotaria magnacalcarata]CAF3820748.1 unnamed protein product [Rotaria magnacalcarata]
MNAGKIYVKPQEPAVTKIVQLNDLKTSADNNNPKLHDDNSTLIKKLRTVEIYKYADGLDIFLLIIGTIGSFASGACLPLLLFVYQQVIDALVNYGKLNYIEQMNVQNRSQLSCENGGFDVPNNTTSPIRAIKNVVSWYVLLGFLSILFYTIGFSAYMMSAERQIRRIRFRLFRNILYQEMSFFDILGGKGKLSNMLTDDLLKIKDGIGDKMADFLSLLARMIGCLLFALVKGWKLTLVILAVAPLVIIAFNLTIKFTIKYTKEQIHGYAKANSIVQEVLIAIRTVTAFNGQKKEYERYANSLSKVPLIGIKKGIIQGLCQIFSNLAIGIVFTAALWYGQYLIKTECGAYSAGILVTIIIACLNTTWCLNQIVPSLEKFADATASGSFIFETMSRKSKIDASAVDEGEKPVSFTGEIKLENVQFTYPARPEQPILQTVNLTIPSGKTVALVGQSGCGKSTIFSLIIRMYDPDDGQVLLDGRDIRKLNIEWLRSQIGYVGQEPVLFSGTIEDNIRLGKPDATEEEIYEAAEMSNAHSFILELPEKYQTSAKGMLSGGQKQRIAIARAIISDPKILLLDEATSALDNRSEKIVQNALNKASQGRTTIIIAHRLTTIQDADLILVFDKGHIIEQGTHKELLQIENGLYRSLAAHSDPDEEEEATYGIERKTSRTSSLKSSRKMSSSTIEEASLHENEQNSKHSCCHTPFFIKLLKLNSPEKFYLLIGCICSLTFGCVEPGVGLIYSIIFGLLANPNLEEQSQRTRDLSLIIFSIYIFAGIVQCLSTITFAKSGEALTLRMRLRTFEAMLRQDISWFDEEKNSVGSLITRLSTDTAALRGLTGVRLNALVSSLGALIFTLIITLMAGWKLTLVVLCFTPLLIFSGYLQGQTQSKAGQSKTAKSFAEEGGRYAVEAIQDIRTVATLNQEFFFIQRYEEAFNQDFKKRMCKIQIQALGKAIANSFLYFIQVTAFSYGASLVENGEMDFSQVFRVYIVINFASMSIGRSTSAMPDYSIAKTAAERILALHNRQSAIDPYNEDGIKLNDFQGNIEFHNITFSYPTRKARLVLRNFNLKCLQGQTTALIGSSGCGKSTTISLLLRFYDSTNGKIFLDKHDIKILNINWLRSIIGFVQQEPILFNRTIAENIAYGIQHRQVALEEIEEAAKQANIHQEIIQFPQGYETNCGNVGNSQLSGGQKQRIAIARALLSKPKILLLDEATSALDNTSEGIVQEAIDNARKGRTCLTIAHRLTTIKNSEKIAVVKSGRVREEGQHEDLLRQQGLYYKLQRATEQSHNQQ